MVTVFFPPVSKFEEIMFIAVRGNCFLCLYADKVLSVLI